VAADSFTAGAFFAIAADALVVVAHPVGVAAGDADRADAEPVGVVLADVLVVVAEPVAVALKVVERDKWLKGKDYRDKHHLAER
jgi:prephenate dehydrogenase